MEAAILPYIPLAVSLYYVDYRDDLDEHEDIQQDCVRNNTLLPLYEKIDDWYGEQEAQFCKDELDAIQEKMSEDGREEEFEEHEDEIRDLLYERNDADPVQGLIKNTRTTNMFYSLGVEIDGYHNDWCGGYRGESEAMACYKIRRALKLKKGQFDDRISELVQNASYGGELRIYFNAMFDDLVNSNEKGDFKTIRFHGEVVVAVADSHNGSGFDITLPLDLTLPFKRDNLFVDSQVHYSYASEVCGMCHDWCDSTRWELGVKPIKSSIQSSKMAAHVQQEAQYVKTYQAGGCTAGDMNMTRHRGVFYDNNFPCGNHCPHCGTFWVD